MDQCIIVCNKSAVSKGGCNLSMENNFFGYINQFRGNKIHLLGSKRDLTVRCLCKVIDDVNLYYNKQHHREKQWDDSYLFAT